MNTLLIIAMAVILCLGIVVLRLDTKRSRINQQLARMLPTETRPGTLAPISMRLKQERVGWRSTLLRALLRYEQHTPRQRLFGGIGLIALLAATGLSQFLVPNWAALIVGLIAALLVMRWLFAWQHAAYADALLRQLPDTLELIVSAVRAGLPITEALHAVANETAEPTKREFVLAKQETILGRSVDEAILDIFRRSHLREYAMFSVTLAVQNKAGGGLAETLQTLADTVRQRAALAGRAKSLAGEAKLSARVLAGLPFVAGGFMYLINPASMMPLFTDHIGRMMLAYGLVSVLLGIAIMQQMIKKGTTV